MQGLDAALAFGITMLVLAMVVTTIVETLHRIFGLREKGLALGRALHIDARSEDRQILMSEVSGGGDKAVEWTLKDIAQKFDAFGHGVWPRVFRPASGTKGYSSALRRV
jgi:hypothetical protein